MEPNEEAKDLFKLLAHHCANNAAWYEHKFAGLACSGYILAGILFVVGMLTFPFGIVFIIPSYFTLKKANECVDKGREARDEYMKLREDCLNHKHEIEEYEKWT